MRVDRVRGRLLYVTDGWQFIFVYQYLQRKRRIMKLGGHVDTRQRAHGIKSASEFKKLKLTFGIHGISFVD